MGWFHENWQAWKERKVNIATGTRRLFYIAYFNSQVVFEETVQ